jgi:hypothetical protein
MYKNRYITQSLSLAAAIQTVSTGKLLFVDKGTGEKSSFVFEKTSDLEQIVEKFYKKELLVDAFSYFESLRYLKSYLYSKM